MYGKQAPTKIMSKLRQFLAEMPQWITKIREAIAATAHHEIAKEAHSFKSMAGYVGGIELAQVCNTLEQEARQQSSAQYANLDQCLVHESERLSLSLEAEIVALLDHE